MRPQSAKVGAASLKKPKSNKRPASGTRMKAGEKRERLPKEMERKAGKFKEDHRVKKVKGLSVSKENPVKFIIRRDKLRKTGGEETPPSQSPSSDSLSNESCTSNQILHSNRQDPDIKMASPVKSMLFAPD